LARETSEAVFLALVPDDAETNRDRERRGAASGQCGEGRSATPSIDSRIGTAHDYAAGAAQPFQHLWLGWELVEQRGIEPLTSALRTPRSPN
jgi:hypothetical protein